MNKLLNNLLGMYKQAKMKKSAMIIDEILDRKDGASYNPQDFYDYVSQQLDVLNSKDIATALDSGTEEDVKKALCEYIKLGEYNPAICDYINSVNWLEEEDVEKWFSIKLSDEQAKEFAKLLTENNIKNKSKKEGEEIRVSFFLLPSSIGVAQGLLTATLSKFPDKQAKLNKKAEQQNLKQIFEKAMGNREPIIETANGVFYFEPKGDKIVFGTATNVGISQDYVFDYDFDMSFDQNIQNMTEEVFEKEGYYTESSKRTKIKRKAGTIEQQINDKKYSIDTEDDNANRLMGIANEIVNDSDLIAQVLSMTKNQKEDEFSIVTLSPDKDKVLGVKYIKKDEVYDYKPNQNEYALVMTRDTGFADTDYQLQPMIMVVRSWNEGRKFYATKKNRLNKKAEEELIEIGWGFGNNDEEMIKDTAEELEEKTDRNFWERINKDISNVESDFLKDGYKKFFTKVRDEGHDSNNDLGGTAWVTKQQLEDFINKAQRIDKGSYGLYESAGELDIDTYHDDALVFHLEIYVDEETLDNLNIESKRVSKNKKLSSKNTKLTKKAKEYGISDYLNHFNDVQQYVLTENKGDLGKAVEDLLGFASSEYDKARFPREYVYKLVKEYIDDTIKFQEMIHHPIKEEYIVKAKELLNNYKVENKIASKTNKLHKQAKKESVVYYDNSLSPREDAQVHKVTYYDTAYNTWGDGNADHEFISVEQFEKETGKKIEELKEKEKITIKLAMTNRNRFGKKADLSKDFDDAESFAKKIIEENKHSFSDYADMQKLENNAYSMFLMDNASIKEVLDEAKKIVSELDNDKDKKFEDAGLYFGMKDRALLAEKVLEEKTKQEKQSSKAKLVRKQAKYEETVQGDEKVKDSAKAFGYDIKFAGHYGRWIYYYLIDEKGNIIRDDKEYQKVYDEMKKRIDDDIDINGYDFVKALIEEVDGELMRVPTIAISEYSLLPNHKDREENTGLEEFKRDFNLSSSTKKQADKVLTLKEAIGKDESEFKNMEDIVDYMNHLPLNANKSSWAVEGFGGNSIDVENLSNGEKATIKLKKNFNSRYATRQNKLFKSATIKHENGVYNVYSESGKCLGKGYKTKEEAEKRLKQVEYFKHKKSSVIKKAKNLSEIDGDAEFMSDLEIGNGMPYNSDDYDYFEVYKIHAKNPKDTYNNKYVVVSDDGSILAVREKEEDIIEITYDDMLQELRWRRLSNRKTQPNKRTSLKQVVISKMAKIKK